VSELRFGNLLLQGGKLGPNAVEHRLPIARLRLAELEEAEALAITKKLGYPVLVRPSFVLGGRSRKPGGRRTFSGCCLAR